MSEIPLEFAFKTPLEFARNILRQWKPDIDLDGGDGSMKRQMQMCDRSYLYAGRDANGRAVFFTSEDRKGEEVKALVDEALRNPVAFEAANELAADDLLNGKPSEPSLRKFAVDFLTEKIKKPIRKGLSKYGYMRRDRCFAFIAYNLQKYYACHLYRNDESPVNLQSCACDIIVEAAEIEGITPASYNAVRAAWEKYGIKTPTPDTK